VILNFGSSLPPLDEHALAFAQIYPAAVECIKPRGLVPSGEPQKQPFHLHAAAGLQQGLQLART